MTAYRTNLNRPGWQALVLFAAGFWLSISLCIDLLVMPSLYTAGMMTQANFATAGYEMFWWFNRVELICAGSVLTGLLVLRQGQDSFSVIVSGVRSRWAVGLGLVLLAIAACYTYWLTPEMSALGLQLSALTESASATPVLPAEMNLMHGLYWGLELVKLLSAAALLRFCYRDMLPTAS
ncbi:MAG: hypothetical protein AAGF66_11455 [Cyanobacteria bacterium P01_H01_bin.119]